MTAGCARSPHWLLPQRWCCWPRLLRRRAFLVFVIRPHHHRRKPAPAQCKRCCADAPPAPEHHRHRQKTAKAPPATPPRKRRRHRDRITPPSQPPTQAPPAQTAPMPQAAPKVAPAVVKPPAVAAAGGNHRLQSCGNQKEPDDGVARQVAPSSMGGNEDPTEKPIHRGLRSTVPDRQSFRLPLREWNECAAAKACGFTATGSGDAPCPDVRAGTTPSNMPRGSRRRRRRTIGSERGRMGIRRARLHADQVLVGRSVSERAWSIARTASMSRPQQPMKVGEPQAESVRTLRHGRRRRSVGRGLLAQELSGRAPSTARRGSRGDCCLTRDPVGLAGATMPGSARPASRDRYDADGALSDPRLPGRSTPVRRQLSMKIMRHAIIALSATLSTAVVRCSRAGARRQARMPISISSGRRTGTVIKGAFWARFGLRNMGVTHAGDDFANAGHHHLLIDVERAASIPKSRSRRTNPIFISARGQTEARIELPPGKHTLQLVLGDAKHYPVQSAAVSKKITAVTGSSRWGKRLSFNRLARPPEMSNTAPVV